MIFLFFPLSALTCIGLESLSENFFARVLPKAETPFRPVKAFSAFTAYDGLVPAALIITFALAGTFPGAVVLALFFAIGNFMAILILNQVRRRATLERVPRCMRGAPLILVSMGLLALISASAAGISFRILEAFQ